MKKLLVLSLVFFIFGVSFGQNFKGKTISKPITDDVTVQFLTKTTKIIKICHQKVRINQVYTGGVYSAKEFQIKAIDFYKQDMNQKAVNKSFVARRLASRAYVANIGSDIPQDWKLTSEEKKMVKINVTKQMIDDILDETSVEKEAENDFDVDDLEELDKTDKGKR